MKKVLIIDDDVRVCEELSEFLIRNKYEVFSATKPSTAFQILAAQPIDILFLDFTLPEMDGLQILKIMTREHPEIKTIMISGCADRTIVDEARRSGAVEFIHKPFLPQQVNEVLKLSKKF
ncbi:MAG: response regulator [Candidatus Cloacimonetes bacterium]|nr:response regulator [Candidatus Cloacimonadota bacterium]MCF7868775.1 response regulator [Candidatus Cloacimonadota bacterium]MCF7884205.1 response regulator [Candidatus Cloacimonadota bacterium]